MDFSSLSTLLSSLQSAQSACTDRVVTVESSARLASLSIRGIERDMTALQKEVASSVGSVGELRLVLQKVRTATENLPADLTAYVRKDDLPCTRDEWAVHTQQVSELVSPARRAADQQAASAAAEIAALRAEVAELTLSHAQISKAVRDLTHALHNRSDAASGGAGVDVRHSNPNIAAVAGLAVSDRPSTVVLGERATALKDAGKKKPADAPATTKTNEKEAKVTTPPPVAAAIAPANLPTSAAVDSTPAIAALTAKVSTLTSTVASLQSELQSSRKESSRLTSDLASLRSGFTSVGSVAAVPFVAPVANTDRPATLAALQPTMVAVSLQCDGCTVNTAVVFCVHCAPGGQRLCGTCDAAVHATVAQPPSAVEVPQRRLSSNAGLFGGGSGVSGGSSGASSALGVNGRHLRLEISKALEPGSRLMSSDLSFIHRQSDAHAQSQTRESHVRLAKALEEVGERLDRHDLQFGALAVSLNAVDEADSKFAALERDILAVRTKIAESDRTWKETQLETHELKDRVDTMQAQGAGRGGFGGAGGGAPSAASPTSLASMSVVSTSTNPVAAGLAKQLHLELDQHKRQTHHAFLDLVAKLDTFVKVDFESLSERARNTDRAKVDTKQFLHITERIIALESQQRSLANSQGFTAKKLTEHLEAWNETLASWTCQHCDTGVLACAGPCADETCKRRICWECSRAGRGGHTSEVGRGGGGGGGGGGIGVTAHALQALIESSSPVRDLQSQLAHLQDEQDKTNVTAKYEQIRVQQMIDMLAQMNLVLTTHTAPSSNTTTDATQPPPPAPFKLGPSAALLLDSRTLTYYESLGDLFSRSLPSLVDRVGLVEHRAEVLSDSLSTVERRNREFDVASRPFVEDRFAAISTQVALVEKATVKKMRADLRRFEADWSARVKAERAEEKERLGIETSIARVHFRCVACDQPVASQPGPLSREYQQQLALHNAQVHGIPLTHSGPTIVAGFASPSSTTLLPSARAPTGDGVSSAPPHLSGLGVVSVGGERGHMFVDPGQRTTLHSNTDNTVYRGREDTRISFTPAAPIGHAEHARSASFQTVYAKVRQRRHDRARISASPCNCSPAAQSHLPSLPFLCAPFPPVFRVWFLPPVLPVAVSAAVLVTARTRRRSTDRPGLRAVLAAVSTSIPRTRSRSAARCRTSPRSHRRRRTRDPPPDLFRHERPCRHRRTARRRAVRRLVLAREKRSCRTRRCRTASSRRTAADRRRAAVPRVGHPRPHRRDTKAATCPHEEHHIIDETNSPSRSVSPESLKAPSRLDQHSSDSGTRRRRHLFEAALIRTVFINTHTRVHVSSDCFRR